MFEVTVFVPGVRQLTNQMLSDLRAAGHYEGRARQMRRRPEPGHDVYAAEVEAIRLSSLAAWRRWQEHEARLAERELSSKRRVLMHGVPELISVRFYVTGHHRHDPDAWYLLAKPAIDGMAKALALSDRFTVWDVGGRVSREYGELYSVRSGRELEDRVECGPGFWMDISGVRRP